MSRSYSALLLHLETYLFRKKCVTIVKKGGEKGEERRLLMFSLILMLTNSLLYPFVLLFG